MLERLAMPSGKPRKFFYLLAWEAGFVVLYDTLISPVYLSGLAGEFKVPLGLVSILAAVPSIGASGQVLGAWLLERSHSIKIYVLGMATLGRLLWSVPLILAVIWGTRTYLTDVPFPIISWFTITTICACSAALLTSASANGWMYWMKSLVPSRFQGRFFANRQRFTNTGFLFASFLASCFIGWAPHGYRIGASLLCLLAIIAGLTSVYIQTFVDDVAPMDNNKNRSFFEMFKKPLQDTSFRKFLYFGAAFNGTLQLATSYYSYYFTRELNIPMSTVVLWGALSNVGALTTAKYWGKRADQSKRTKSILWYTGHVIAASPLVYFLLQYKPLLLMLAPFEYFIFGSAFCGFAIAQTKILFHMSPSRGGSSYFSTFAVICGLSGAVCTVLGGNLAHFLEPWGGFRVLWLMTFFARLAVLWGFRRPFLMSSIGNSRRKTVKSQC